MTIKNHEIMQLLRLWDFSTDRRNNQAKLWYSLVVPEKHKILINYMWDSSIILNLNPKLFWNQIALFYVIKVKDPEYLQYYVVTVFTILYVMMLCMPLCSFWDIDGLKTQLD